jgi:sugar lactone lactonase YvrE
MTETQAKRKRVVSVGSSLLVVALVLAALTGVASAQEGTTVATGLNGPQGILVAPDGTLWVSEAGFGGEEEIEMSAPLMGEGEPAPTTIGETARVVAIAPDGSQTVAATLPSIAFGQEVAGVGRLALLDGTLYATNGDWIELAGMESRPFMAVVVEVADGEATEVADTWAFEVANNPDPNLVHSHPYDLEAGPDGWLWVTEAGGNNLITVDPATGEIELVTVFAGVPSPLPNGNRGGAQESDPVPTGVAFDADGNAYVSLLPGFPFLPGASKVVKVGADSSVSDYATGMTMLTDLQAGPDGMLYAVSIGQFSEQGPVPNMGTVLRIKEGAASEVLVEGLSFPTSIDFNDAGDAFVTINGVGAPGSGAVVRFDGLTSMAGSPLPAPPSAPAPAPAETGASEAAAEPEALPETGGSPLGLGWIIAAAGLVVVMAGLVLSARQRQREDAGSEQQ